MGIIQQENGKKSILHSQKREVSLIVCREEEEDSWVAERLQSVL